jgi:hypothetical protein
VSHLVKLHHEGGAVDSEHPGSGRIVPTTFLDAFENQRNFKLVILAIIVVSVLPIVVEYLRARKAAPA